MLGTQSLIDMIQEIVEEKTLYLRHFVARVISNVSPMMDGSVLVTCDELGWSTPDLGVWVYPRSMHSYILPKPLQYVEIYFLNGDRDRPVYIGLANEMTLQRPRAFDGMPTTNIIYQNPTTQDYIKYDEKVKKFTIGGTIPASTFIDLGVPAPQAVMLGTLANTFLANLVTALNSHVHVVSGITAGGASVTSAVPTVPFVAPAGLLSTKVKVAL